MQQFDCYLIVFEQEMLSEIDTADEALGQGGNHAVIANLHSDPIAFIDHTHTTLKKAYSR